MGASKGVTGVTYPSKSYKANSEVNEKNKKRLLHVHACMYVIFITYVYHNMSFFLRKISFQGLPRPPTYPIFEHFLDPCLYM